MTIQPLNLRIEIPKFIFADGSFRNIIGQIREQLFWEGEEKNNWETWSFCTDEGNYFTFTKDNHTLCSVPTHWINGEPKYEELIFFGKLDPRIKFEDGAIIHHVFRKDRTYELFQKQVEQ